MKKNALTVLILSVAAILLVSCSGGKEGGFGTKEMGTDASESEKATTGQEKKVICEEDLFYYKKLENLLKNNQPKEELGEACVRREYGIVAYNEIGEPQYTAGGQYAVYLDESLGYPFAELSSKLRANPFSNFNLLVQKGWVTPIKDSYFASDHLELKEKGVPFDLSGLLDFGMESFAYNTPIFSVERDYKYSQEGCEDFLRTVVALESANENNTKIVAAIDHFLERKVYYSKEDDCYYSFFIDYDRIGARITALYFRSTDGNYVTDVTAQLMLVAYPWGDPGAGAGMSHAMYCDSMEIGAFSFFMSLEKALTGNSYFSNPFIYNGETVELEKSTLVVPYEYGDDRYTAKLSQNIYEAALDYPNSAKIDGEIFTTYTYSIALK